MAVLPYCVFSSAAEVGLRGAGVRAAELKLAYCDELNAIYSEHAELDSPTKEDALAFHGVIESIFSRVAVVPFRFPTLLASQAELEEHLRARHQNYSADLDRFRDLVQMELLICGLRAAEKRPENGAAPGSEYLKMRGRDLRSLESAATATRGLLAGNIVDWRQSAPAPHPAKGEAVRCYALVERTRVGALRQRVPESISAGTSITLSGPWPPAAFMQSTAKALA